MLSVPQIITAFLSTTIVARNRSLSNEHQLLNGTQNIRRNVIRACFVNSCRILYYHHLRLDDYEVYRNTERDYYAKLHVRL